MTDSIDAIPAKADDLDEAPVSFDDAPDDVLRLQLDRFEGPLELLLYLIKAQEIDIFDIPIVKITDQYLRFLSLMHEDNLDATSEFLVMAATLIHIKSRMLLPPDVDPDDEEPAEEEDPRLELVAKLLEYRQYRELGLQLRSLEEQRELWFTRDTPPDVPADDSEGELLDVTLYDLMEAFRAVLRYFHDDLIHTVIGEGSSVDEKIEYIEACLDKDGHAGWMDLFRSCSSSIERVCCFLAILELCRMGRIRVHQHQPYGEIRLFPKDADDTPALALNTNESGHAE